MPIAMCVLVWTGVRLSSKIIIRLKADFLDGGCNACPSGFSGGPLGLDRSWDGLFQPFPCTQRLRPSPYTRKVGDHIGLFEACSTFTGYYGLSARRVAYSDPSVSKAPTVSFPPRVASIATGWSDPVAGWDLHPLKTNTLHGSRRTHCLSIGGLVHRGPLG